ncbi:type II toxin-antitoxin system RelE/ParE family toxin [bacterium]|nr:type II toxin-antitoxin system RelE/ParE family toxin [bacterium]
MKLRVPDPVRQQIKKLHPALKQKMRNGLDVLLKEPHLGKPLKDEFSGLLSFRMGKYRIIYKLADANKTLEIIALGPRRTIYEETYRLLKKN